MTITRRTFERQRLWPPVLARIGPASALEILDLSEGGAGVLSSEPLTQGETIRLQIPLPSQEAVALSSRLAEATGETVWAAKTGRAGIRFLDLPIDSRSLLQEWIRHDVLSGQTLESEAVQPKAPLTQTARPASQFAHPWAIVAVAIILGITGGIWLATREDQSQAKPIIPAAGVQQLPKAPFSGAPAPDKIGGALPETPQVKPREDQSQAKANIPAAGVEQLPKTPVSAAPVPDKIGGALSEAPPVKPREDQSQAKAIVPAAGVRQLTKLPVSAAPVHEKPAASAPEASQVKPRADRLDLRRVANALPAVQAMRFSHQSGLTKVEIELGASVLLRTGRLHRPERIYFDVRDRHREKGIVRRLQEQKIGESNDLVLTGVRVAPLRSGDVRVVLDLNRSCEYSHRLASKPASSLIVELREPSAPAGEAPKPQ